MQTVYKRQLVLTGVIAVLFAIGGAVLMALGAGRFLDTRQFIAGAKRAEGRVSGFERWESSGSRERDRIVYAVVLFTVEEGREIRFQGPSQHGLQRYRQGDRVEVLYQPENSDDARIDSFMGLWFGATMLCTIGLAAIVIPLLTMWQAWVWVKRQETVRVWLPTKDLVHPHILTPDIYALLRHL